jgi:hypothetical protein
MCFVKAGVAQLAEQRIRNAQAGGSIPLSGTIQVPENLHKSQMNGAYYQLFIILFIHTAY